MFHKKNMNRWCLEVKKTFKNVLQSYHPATLLWNETGEDYSFFEEYVPGI